MIAAFGVPLLVGLLMVSAIPSAFAYLGSAGGGGGGSSYSVAEGPFQVYIPAATYLDVPPFIIPGVGFAYIPPPDTGCYADSVNIDYTSFGSYFVTGQVEWNQGLFLFYNAYWNDVTASYYVVWIC